MGDWMTGDWITIVAAAGVGYGFGAVWYMALAKHWMAAAGLTEDEIKNDPSPLPFLIAGIGAVTASWTMNWILGRIPDANLTDAATLGLAIGVLIGAPWLVLHYGFGKRPTALWWIDGAHTAIALTLIGVVLGLLR